VMDCFALALAMTAAAKWLVSLLAAGLLRGCASRNDGCRQVPRQPAATGLLRGCASRNDGCRQVPRQPAAAGLLRGCASRNDDDFASMSACSRRLSAGGVTFSCLFV
ncbi:MAG: hypothetical protein LBH18_07445, partial [Spirochaetaceae bacterium]|nr:hypothetical protein [Spirochaetaceae bacterium]